MWRPTRSCVVLPMKKNKVVRIVFYGLLGIVGILALLFYSRIFSYLVAGVVFAYLLKPLTTMLERWKVHRLLSIIIVYSAFMLLIFAGIWFLIPMIIEQAQDIWTSYKEFMQKDGAALARFQIFDRIDLFFGQLETKLGIPMDQVQEKITGFFEKQFTGILSNLGDLVRVFITLMSFIVAIPIVGFFMLKDEESIKSWFLSVIPNRYFEMTIILVEKIDEIIGTYIRALLIEVIIVGILATIVLTALGVQYSLLIGLIAGFANAIPYFGPWIGALLAMSSVLISGQNPIMLLWVGGGMALVQALDNNLIYPIVIGNKTEMHPLVIMLTVIAGGYLFGILGMFLSVPVLFLLRGLITVMYRNLKEFEII